MVLDAPPWRATVALPASDACAAPELNENWRIGEKVGVGREYQVDAMLSAEMHRGNREAIREGSYGRFLYNYFRTYDPNTGRYLEADPVGQFGMLLVKGASDLNHLLETFDNPAVSTPRQMGIGLAFTFTRGETFWGALRLERVLGDDGASPYAYAIGNPLRNVDPSGLGTEDAVEASICSGIKNPVARKACAKQIDKRVCKSMVGLATCCNAEFARCVDECREDVPGAYYQCLKDKALCMAPITQ